MRVGAGAKGCWIDMMAEAGAEKSVAAARDRPTWLLMSHEPSSQPVPHLLSRHGGAQHVGQHCGQKGRSGCCESCTMQVVLPPIR